MGGSDRTSWSGRIALGAILAVGAAFRLLDLGRESLWLDELFTTRVVDRATWGELGAELAGDVHPPLYFALLRLWTGVAGTGDAAFRLPSAVAGIVTVALVARLGRQLCGRTAGLFAAALYAVAPFAIGLEREARGNALLTLLATAGASLLMDVGVPGTRVPIAYAIVAAALLWTHPFGAFVVLSHAIWLAIEAPAAAPGRVVPALRPWVEALVAAALSFLPWVRTLSGQWARFAADPWYRSPAPDSLGPLLVSVMGGSTSAALLLVGIGLLLVRSVAAPDAARDPGPVRAVTLLAATIAGVVLVPQALSWTAAPVLQDRNLLPVLPILCVAAGAGFAALRPSRLAASALAIPCGALLLLSAGTIFGPPRLEQWREAARVVTEGWRDGDEVWANHPFLWAHYLKPPVAVRERPTGADVDAALAALHARGGRLWAVWAREGEPEEPLPGVALVDTRFLGTHVRLVDPDARAVEVGADLAPPMREPDGLHFYWAFSARSGPLDLHGRCRIGVRGHGDAAAGEAARLALGWIATDGAQLGETVVDLPTETGFVWGEPVDVAGTVTIEIAFVNDARIDGPDGVEDRNAHVTEVFRSCAGAP